MKIPADVDTARLPSPLALSDVYLTGYRAAHMGRVEPGKTVTVIGDGAEGPPRGRGRRRADAEKIILMGRHTSCTDLGREWGATDVVAVSWWDVSLRIRRSSGMTRWSCTARRTGNVRMRRSRRMSG